MDYRDTPEEADFRAELRKWLAANIPAGWQDATDDASRRALTRQWHKTLFEAGYVGMSWPTEYGGRNLSPVYDAILTEESAAADAPPMTKNVNYLGRAMWTHGTNEQKQRFLPTMLSGEILWCQGFSEPEAGSDIGSLRTKGTRESNGWKVNGHKLWTSHAHVADWCLLLVRTNPEAPKHAGISCLMTPTAAPGVTISPTVLANGDPDTSEVFFDDVEIPNDQILGAEGDGWRIAMTTLSYERGPDAVGFVAQYRRTLDAIEQAARQRGRIGEAQLRRDIAEAYVRGEALRLNIIEQLSARANGAKPDERSSIAKLLWIDAEQYLHHLAMDLAGADALTGAEPKWLPRYLYSRAASVYGGTEQIQKNILAQRVLGMPR